MFKVVSISLFFILLSACSSTHNFGVVYHERFDFSQVKNYSLYNRNSPFTDSQSLLDTHRNAIEISIESTMASLGFEYITLEKAGLIVTYFVVNGNSKEYARYNEVVKFCVHCLRASTWQSNQQPLKNPVGSLIVDLIDPKTQRSVWRSAYPLESDSKDNSAQLNAKIRQAVTVMLSQYP